MHVNSLDNLLVLGLLFVEWAVLGDVAFLATLEASTRLDSLALAELSQVASLSTVVTFDWGSTAILREVVETTAVVANDTVRSGSLSLWSVTVLGDVANLTAVVTLLLRVSWLWAVRLDVTNLSAVKALLLSSLLWERAVLGLMVWGLAVVAESVCLWAVFGLVAGHTALVAGSREVSHRILDEGNEKFSISIFHRPDLVVPRSAISL